MNRLKQLAKEIEQRMGGCVELDLLDELKQYRELFDNVMEQLKALDK